MTSPVFFVKPVWQEDATAAACNACQENFTVTRRRHHCRACGKIFCADCSAFKVELPAQFEYTGPERVCNACKEGLVKNIEAYNSMVLMAQFYTRGTSATFVAGLHEVGSRSPFEKIFASLKGKGGKPLVLSMTRANSCTFNLASESKKAAFEALMKDLCDHPFIMSPDSIIEYVREKDVVVAITPRYCRGSVKDRIFKIRDPLTLNNTQKYGPSKQGAPLSFRHICMYSRCVLEAMLFLKRISFPVLHLHSGNVLVDEENPYKCYLGPDLLNSLIGSRPRNPLLFQGQELKNIEVVQFGYFLFEMVFGMERQPELPLNSFRDKITVPEFAPLYKILKKIFRGEKSWWDSVNNRISDAKSEPVPSIEELLTESVFAEKVPIENPATLEGLKRCSKWEPDKHQRSILKKVEESFVESLVAHMKMAKESVVQKNGSSSQVSPPVSPSLSPRLSPRLRRKKKKNVGADDNDANEEVVSRESYLEGYKTTTSVVGPMPTTAFTASSTASSRGSSYPATSTSSPPVRAASSSSSSAPPPAPPPSTASANVAPPPPPPPPSSTPAPPPPPPMTPPVTGGGGGGGRGDLLASIRQNNMSKLKKVVPPR